MDFPSYVPSAVRLSMAARLEGDSRVQEGWLSLLAEAEAEVQKLDALQSRDADDPDALDDIRRQRLEAVQHRDQLATAVACLQRLVHDARMQPAYVRLAGMHAVNDSHLSGFIHAAWAARIDYTKHRDRMAAANDLVGKVAEAAGVLADLLGKAELTGGHNYFPSVLFSLQSLLEKTEHDRGDRDFRMWHGMRRVVLGEPPPKSDAEVAVDAGTSEHAGPPKIELKFVGPGEAEPIAQAEAARNALRYAWGTVPNMSRIIATMHREALTCVATESGFIGAAVRSRKKNPKAAYLRAFGALLRDEHGFDLDSSVRDAMATTATVVLNDPDDPVSTADVSSALLRIGA